MRVVECNICGEVVRAADDDELLGALREHMGSAHQGSEVDDDQLREQIAGGSYTATDS